MALLTACNAAYDAGARVGRAGVGDRDPMLLADAYGRQHGTNASDVEDLAAAWHSGWEQAWTARVPSRAERQRARRLGDRLHQLWLVGYRRRASIGPRGWCSIVA